MPLPTRVFGWSDVASDHERGSVKTWKNFLDFDFHIIRGLVCWLLPRLVAFQAQNPQAFEWM